MATGTADVERWVLRWQSFAARGLACAVAGCALLGLLLGSAAVLAQPVPPPPSQRADVAGRADPPGRVGRLAEASGPVWLYSPSTGEWAAAPINRPLTTGDRIATDAAARAVLRVGSTTLRLDGGSEVEFAVIDDERIRLQLHTGSLALRLRNAEKAVELDLVTAEGRFVLQRAGRYRLDRRDAATSVSVWQGQGVFEGRGNAQTLYSRQRGDFWFDPRMGDTFQYSIVEPLLDAFASWVATRDLQDDRLAASRHVSTEMTGFEELDQHGRWEETAEYGAVWVPRAVQPGWAPYRHGHWAWISPWGYTWIDDAPWGFAPFHYGRWVWWRDAWGWAPGRWVARPVYAPALVAWIGGPNVSVGLSVGGPSVGWFPLAPFEPFVPWYGVSPRYVHGINHGYVRSPDHVNDIIANPGLFVGRYPYAYRWREPAVTVVPGATLVGRQPVAPAAQPWIQHPSIRGTVYDQGRGTGVVIDPGYRPGPPRAGVGLPPRPTAPAPGFVAAPAPGFVLPPGSGGLPTRPVPLPPVGAIEPDRRMHLPDRLPRNPPMPVPGAYVPPPVSVAPPAQPVLVAPPTAMPSMPSITSNEAQAQRIGREPLPQVGRPDNRSFLPPSQPAAPMPPAERVFSNPERMNQPPVVRAPVPMPMPMNSPAPAPVIARPPPPPAAAPQPQPVREGREGRERERERNQMVR